MLNRKSHSEQWHTNTHTHTHQYGPNKICSNTTELNTTMYFNFTIVTITLTSRSQWPRGLRRGSTAARLLRSWVRIPQGAWMYICFECCVLSGRSLCDELITRPEESYRLWCVVVCDLEKKKKTNLVNEEGQGLLGGYRAKRKKNNFSKLK